MAERSAGDREAARRERARRRAARDEGARSPAGPPEPSETEGPGQPGEFEEDGHDGEFHDESEFDRDSEHHPNDDHDESEFDRESEHHPNDDHDEFEFDRESEHHPNDDHDEFEFDRESEHHPDDDHDEFEFDRESEHHPDDDHDEFDFDRDSEHDPDDDHDDADGDHEIASGTRRIARIAHLERSRQESSSARGARRLRHGGRAKGAHSRAGRIISLLALVAAGALIWFLVELFQPFHRSGHGSVTVTIPAHSSSSQVGDLLERDGVVSSAFFFELRATLAGERGSLRSGTYHVQQDMSYGAVLKILTTPPPPVPTTELTIAEGHTRHQIDVLLRRQGIRGSYFAATRRSRLLSPRAYGAPRDTPSLEGFLFPDTYQLVKPGNINDLVADQLKTFKQKWRTVNLSFARSQRLTPYDVLIIASMIEGEAQTTHDESLVSSVIYNRLRGGTPLGMDSTIRYTTGNYASPLTASELAVPGPYNTRLNKGLPPTPISNPGLAEIEAAAHPARTSYMFFVTKACGNGSLAFATTYQQFLILDQQYNAARAKHGGRSPTRC